jgi:Flp pilus assembly protein TadD
VFWGNKGACLFQQGMYQEALAAYERALTLAPEELPYYSGKGMCLDYLGYAEEAVACYNRALKLA